MIQFLKNFSLKNSWFLRPLACRFYEEINTLFTRFLKLSVIPLLGLVIALGAVFSLSLNTAAIAASPDRAPQTAIPSLAQAAGFTLEKVASSENAPLGQPVSYTVTIKNEQARPADFNVVDELPAGLALQETSVETTTGTSDLANNTVLWSGTLAAGETASITYAAIPPTTSAVDQTLDNIATLQIGETTLEARASITTVSPDLGIWGRFVNAIAWVLVATDRALNGIGLPYAFGFAIILFTVVVRLATFPLNMQQIKSSKAMQALQPKMKEMQEKYKNDREKLAQEQMALYKEHGVNPLGGCLPLLVQMPIWIGLYRALIQLSTEGLLNQGFFWIPSLAGPVSDNFATSFPPDWLWPFVNGAPPQGWADTIAYLILPVLLVVSQVYMQNMMTPPTTDPQQASMMSIMKFMPLMFGYFALVVPAGLTLYWFTSNILAMGQQYFTRTQFDDVAPSKNKESAAIPSSAPIPDNTPVPANSASSANPAAAVSSAGNRKSKNVKSRRKRRRRRR